MNNRRIMDLLMVLEWSRQRAGPTPRFHGSMLGVALLHEACPVCGGVKPGEAAAIDFFEYDIGHHSACELALAINFLAKSVRDHEAPAEETPQAIDPDMKKGPLE